MPSLKLILLRSQAMLLKLRLNSIRILFYLFLISIPFGTRVLLYQFTTGFHEYEAVFIYSSDILLTVFLALFSVRRFIEFKNQKSKCKITIKNPKILLFVFLVIVFISVFFAPSKGLAIYDFARLVFLVLMAFAVARILKEGIIKLESIFAIIAGSAVLQSLIGIFQFIKQSSLGLGFLGESVIGPDVGGAAKIVVEGGKILRVYGTFPHPNVLAAFLILGLCALYFFWLRNTKEIRIYETDNVAFRNFVKFSHFVALSVGMFIVSLGLLFAFSRTAWLIAILATIATILYSRDWKLGIIISAIALIIFSAFSPYLFSRAKVSGQEPSVSYRLAYGEMALEIIKERPFGVGIGNQVLYSVKNGVYQKMGMDQVWQWQPIHNFYLLASAEIGVLGLISLLFFIICVFWRVSKNYYHNHDDDQRNTQKVIVIVILLSLLTFGLTDHFLWTLQPGRLMLWLVIGILLASAHSTMDSAQPSEG